MRLVSLAYGLPLAYEGTKWWEMPRCTEFETATLDGMPTSKVVGSTYHGTPSETSHVYLFVHTDYYDQSFVVQHWHKRLLPWAITY